MECGCGVLNRVIVSGTPPHTLTSSVFTDASVQEVRQLGWPVAIVEKLIHWDFERACHFLTVEDFHGNAGFPGHVRGVLATSPKRQILPLNLFWVIPLLNALGAWSVNAAKSESTCLMFIQ